MIVPDYVLVVRVERVTSSGSSHREVITLLGYSAFEERSTSRIFFVSRVTHLSFVFLLQYHACGMSLCELFSKVLTFLYT